ncbi:MAG: hypothetical protein HOY44_12860 [Maritimibacter sp.]|uniref:hypothetical protein n=1 Tax=Maritimibacter sp. TaxID=2003363 RepID=UPI001E117E8B|nr:hypothetical protein [Maritimibacter sp.]MBL6428412.1 hypothetical protein [Maritimibacter sp.]
MPLEPKYLRLRFNLEGISAPAMKAMQLASDTVMAALPALDAFDVTGEPQIEGTGIQLRFRQAGMSDDDWREQCKSFVVRKAFQELAKGLKESLDEAYSLIHMTRLDWGNIDTAGIMAKREELGRKANRANVPTILDWVNGELGAPLSHTAMVLNVQKVRSCLEHRDGLVGAVDVNNAADDALELSVPTMKIIAIGKDTGAEVEVVPGMQLEEASRVAPKFVDEHLSFPRGARIQIDAERFNHIALSNWVFGSDLAKRVEALLRNEGKVDFS